MNSHKAKRSLLLTLSVLLCLVSLLGSPRSIWAQRPTLPAPLCALITLQVVCYDTQTVTPRVVTPPDQHVSDFNLSPDGMWIAFRVQGSLQIVSAYRGLSRQIDADAAPATLEPDADAIAWSPDGLALAYTTGAGFRIAFPTIAAKTEYVNATDRSYVNLRFSPTGIKIAAQADDHTWSIFAILTAPDGQHSLQRTRTIEQPSDCAWMDDNTLIAAPETGGLLRLDATNPTAPPAWTVNAGYYTKLITTSDKQVLAFNPPAGESVGNTVFVNPDGSLKPLSRNKIDNRVEWGQNGQLMVYITSGTPILVDRVTGDEDSLPLKRVKRIIWAPQPPTPITATPLDADLYFIALDSRALPQVWRLSGTGLAAPAPVTDVPQGVQQFAVSPDKLHAAVVSGGRLEIVPFIGPVAGTFTLRATAEPPHPLATLTGSVSALDWDPTGREIVYQDISGIYLVTPDGSSTSISISASLSTSTTATPAKTAPDLTVFRSFQFSPDGQYILAIPASTVDSALIFSLRDNIAVKLAVKQTVLGIYTTWGPGNLLLNRDPAGATSLAVIALPSQNLIELARAPWQVADGRLISNEAAILLRAVGWGLDAGPEIVQPYFVPIQNALSKAESRGPSAMLNAPLLSPTGKYAAGFWQADTINQLVILNLQSGQRMTIANVSDISSLRWITS